MFWGQIEASVAPFLQRKPRMRHFCAAVDLFGATTEVAGVGVSPPGRPRLPIRLMVSLGVPQAYGLSDDELVRR